MKKVFSILLSVIMVFCLFGNLNVCASADDVVSTVKLAGTSPNPKDFVNIILTDKVSSKSIKYINQVKPDEDGKWRLNFQIEGTLADYNILFRQNNTVSTEISPDFVASITAGMEINLSAIVAAKTVVANLNIKNPDMEETACNVIIATYDANHNVIDSYAPSISIGSTEETIAKEITHNLPQNAAYAKVFCWYDFITPLTKAQTVKPLTKYTQNRGSFGNVFTKLNNGEDVTIAYLGGSVTHGQGALDPNTDSWRAITTKWFRDCYPDSAVTSVFAAVGNTGGFFGSMRLQREVLDYNPDLVFVMFPINDVIDKMSKEDAQRQMEYIIRQIREANPQTDIIMGYDVDISTGSYDSEEDEDYDMVLWHNEVAEAYNISTMNMGRYVADLVLRGETTWGEALDDQVHPSNAGYSLYSKVALSLLADGKLNAPMEVVEYEIPSNRLFGEDMDPIVLYKAADDFVSGAETTRNYNSLYTRKYDIAPGESLTFTITGDSIGIYLGKIWESGHLGTYTIDDTTYNIDWGNKGVTKLATGLGDGKHTVTLTNNSSSKSLALLAAFSWTD